MSLLALSSLPTRTILAGARSSKTSWFSLPFAPFVIPVPVQTIAKSSYSSFLKAQFLSVGPQPQTNLCSTWQGNGLVLVRQPWAQRTPSPPNSSSVADIDAFFYDRNGARSRGCIFCGMLGHRIRGCPAAEEYYSSRRLRRHRSCQDRR